MINNDFYDELGQEWLDRFDHPIALLRAENKTRIPWIINEIGERIVGPANALDVGCGAGLLTNQLSLEGHSVSGIDLSDSSLEIAKKTDTTQNVQYLKANAYCLPFANETFDVVSAMDVLEHVEEPNCLIAEAARVLKPGGLFFFHTFNRNWLSYLLIIKGVEWCVKNAPKHMHVYPLFIKPAELEEYCNTYKLRIVSQRGFQPKVSKAFFQMIASRKVPKDFSFRFSKSLATGYCGIAVKQAMCL